MVVIGLLVLSGCSLTPETSDSPPPRTAVASLPADAAALAERYGLHIVSESTTLPVRVPRRLKASSQWSLKQHFLLRGGFDLRPYAGQQVRSRCNLSTAPFLRCPSGVEKRCEQAALESAFDHADVRGSEPHILRSDRSLPPTRNAHAGCGGA